MSGSLLLLLLAAVLVPPFCCPLTAAKIAGLKATVLLLLALLIKSRIQIKTASALGLFLLALQTLIFLAASGGLALLALGGLAFTMTRRPSAMA